MNDKPFASRIALCLSVLFICLFGAVAPAWAIDIPVMTWTPRADWLNIKTDPRVSPLAVGDGVTDDTAAIQSALNVLNSNGTSTVYFPAGTYKISSTLKITNANRYSLIGCGLNTVIKWYGPVGGAMIWPNSVYQCRYVGFVWDGNGNGTVSSPGTTGAGCAYEEYSDIGGVAAYETSIRHENESFRNFTATGTYGSDNYYPSGYPPAAIISGFNSLPMPVGEVTIFNCCFNNCATAIHNAVDIFNNFMWVVDGCEFDNNGVGFDGGVGSCYVLMNDHFQHSSVVDIKDGFGIHGHRLTSSSSNQFYNGDAGVTFQDCWVDGWTVAAGALQIQYGGQSSIFDCTFTNPPAGALGPIWLYNDQPWDGEIILSNNYAPAFLPGPGILHQQVSTDIDWVPSGGRFGTVTSSTQTFLNSTTVADSTHIIDVTSPTYGAVSSLTTDSTAAFQAAINAARTANNGSVVYIPIGIYKITSTLNVSGGNYTIEGEGAGSLLLWEGGSGGTIMNVTTPQSITFHYFHLECPTNLVGDPNYNGSYPVSDPTTITGIKETSTGASTATFDSVQYGGGYYSNPGAGGDNSAGPGLVFSNLPSTSKVYLQFLLSPLTVQDCGAAQIFSKVAYIQQVNVSGATQPKTGFLGTAVTEGGQGDPSRYNFNITDNQNMVVGDYYTEQTRNDFQLQRGSGTTPGNVDAWIFNAYAGANNGYLNASTYTVNINNYAGRFFYGGGPVTNDTGTQPVQIAHTGTNPLDLILTELNFADGWPGINLGSGANLISTLNVFYTSSGSFAMPDVPSPITSANLASMAAGLDDFRQLYAVDASFQFGTVTDGPSVALYPFENNVLDMSGTNNGTNHGATFAAGAIGTYGAKFNGTSSYVQIPKPVTGSFSISMWLQTADTGATGQWYLGKGLVDGKVTATSSDFGTALNAGKFSLGIGNPNTTLTSTTAVNDGKWHHVVGTWNSTTGAMQVFVDGVSNGTLTGPTGTRSAPPSLRLGSIQTGVTGGFFNGTLDQVQIYNYVLSSTDVAYLYNHNKTVRLSPIAVTGFTQDIIYGPAAGDTTATSLFQGYHLYAAGQGTNGGAGGLPDSGVISSINNPNVVFQLQPYNASNVLPLPGTSGTLTLSTPAKYTNLSVLLTNAGTGGLSYTLNFSDGTHTTVNIASIPYWVGGDAIASGGLLAYQNSILVGDGTPVMLHEYDYALSATDSAKTLNSVTFTGINYSSGSVGIFALSGSLK